MHTAKDIEIILPMDTNSNDVLLRQIHTIPELLDYSIMFNTNASLVFCIISSAKQCCSFKFHHSSEEKKRNLNFFCLLPL